MKKIIIIGNALAAMRYTAAPQQPKRSWLAWLARGRRKK
jgi:hypothetical protein